MNRRFLAGIGLAGAALLAIPAAVFAQTPPDPPATYYGPATGATAGQRVIAIVFSGSGSGVACGNGSVQTFEGNTVYTVDVATNAQTPGCGQSGRTVRFYFPGSGGTPGRFATESASWSGAGARSQPLNVSAGASLAVKRVAPLVASDGTY